MFTLTGTLADHAGQPLAKATLIITPTPAVTIDATGKVIHLGGTEVTTDETGFFTTDLATHDGLQYTVRTTAGGRLRPQRFAAPIDGVTLDLADVTPAPAPSPMAEYVRGASAYELWLAQGNAGTEADFLASLHGADGQDGTDGADGINAASSDRGVITITTGA